LKNINSSLFYSKNSGNLAYDFGKNEKSNLRFRKIEKIERKIKRT
jgi:hypothetical protein